MNTRSIGDQRRFIPASRVADGTQTDPEKSLEAIAFDIADEAASLEELRKAIDAIDARLSAKDEDVSESLRSTLEARKTQLLNQVEWAEKRRAAKGDRD
jgi:hypothetical protein